MSESILEVWAPGLPAPQGSKTHKGGGRMVESSKALKPWRQDVRHAVLAEVMPALRKPVEGPVELELWLFMPRPKSHPKTKRTLPATQPDVDKLVRGVMDALTSAGVWLDDGQVTDLVVRERYAGGPLADAVAHCGIRMHSATTGAHIIVRTLDPATAL